MDGILSPRAFADDAGPAFYVKVASGYGSCRSAVRFGEYARPSEGRPHAGDVGGRFRWKSRAESERFLKAIEVEALGSEAGWSRGACRSTSSGHPARDQKRLILSTKFIGTRPALEGPSGGAHYAVWAGGPGGTTLDGTPEARASDRLSRGGRGYWERE